MEVCVDRVKEELKWEEVVVHEQRKRSHTRNENFNFQLSLANMLNIELTQHGSMNQQHIYTV